MVTCQNISVQEFNTIARDVAPGLTVVSEDDSVDQYDRFIMTKPNGSVSELSIRNKRVRSVLLQYERLCLESRQREREAIVSAFGIRLGDPEVRLWNDCEQFGVYDLEGNHLFDIYANQNSVGKILRYNTLYQTEFTTRGLASLLALKLEREIPEQFRAKIQMDGETRSALAGRFDFRRETLTADNGVLLFYGGNKNEMLLNTDVTLTLESKSSVRVSFTDEYRHSGGAIFNLMDGSFSHVPESK